MTTILLNLIVRAIACFVIYLLISSAILIYAKDTPMTSADTLVVVAALLLFREFCIYVKEHDGQDSREKPTLPGQ
jgi:uncharacterized membrane protein (DUF373 family)